MLERSPSIEVAVCPIFDIAPRGGRRFRVIDLNDSEGRTALGARTPFFGIGLDSVEVRGREDGTPPPMNRPNASRGGDFVVAGLELPGWPSFPLTAGVDGAGLNALDEPLLDLFFFLV